jgi:hypothetical protein
LDAVGGSELLKDVNNVPFYRPNADYQLQSNLLIAKATCHQAKDFDLAFTERFDQRIAW